MPAIEVDPDVWSVLELFGVVVLLLMPSAMWHA